MSKTTARTTGIGFFGAMFLLFLGLRLTDHIDWAWYWVAAPLWMPLGIVLVILAVMAAVLLPIAALIDWKRGRRLARIRRERAAQRTGGSP
jgi:uncharacterized membrane protein YhiD involved in acid resistance